MLKELKLGKLVLYSLIAAFLMVGLCGCNTNADEGDNGDEDIVSNFSPDIVDVDNVIIEAKDVTPTGATIIITDNNAEPYTYTAFYIIQKQNGENWENLTAKKDMTFNELAYLVNDDKQVKFEENWEEFYGALESGTYRLIKDVEGKYIAVTFTI